MTFRSGTYANGTYLYAVNDAPFRVTARVNVETQSDCRLEELTGRRKVPPLKAESSGETYWEIQLEPYDLVAVRLSEANVRLAHPQVTLPKSIEPALGRQIEMLGIRAAALRNPPPINVLENPDFEKPADARKGIPGWSVTSRNGVSVQIDSGTAHGGKQSAHLASTGPVAWLVSRPLPAPTTGRVSMSVWLRIADPNNQPPLRLALECKIDGHDKYSYAPVGRLPNGAPTGVNLGPQWAQCIFQVDDLPLEGITSMRARFDLMGPGEVWVDDVKLCNLAFSRPEIIELSKLITLADAKLQSGQVSDCMHLLEGYWPRFLDENVPPARRKIRPRANASPAWPISPPPKRPPPKSPRPKSRPHRLAEPHEKPAARKIAVLKQCTVYSVQCTGFSKKLSPRPTNLRSVPGEG